MTDTNNSLVNRSEFNAAMRHLETLLSQQTTILRELAVAAVENRARDERAAALAVEVAKLRTEQGEMKLRFAQLTGMGVIIMAVWPFLAKKLGLF